LKVETDTIASIAASYTGRPVIMYVFKNGGIVFIYDIKSKCVWRHTDR